jgi:hypothetical protein
MSTRFEKVIQQASTLPVEIQEEIAEQWLEDIENELNCVFHSNLPPSPAEGCHPVQRKVYH